MDECYKCGFWDSEREGCTCPHSDKWYACPIEANKPENIEELKKYAEWASKAIDNCKDAFLRLTTEIETTISNCRAYAKVMRLETNNSRKRNHKPMRRKWSNFYTNCGAKMEVEQYEKNTNTV